MAVNWPNRDGLPGCRVCSSCACQNCNLCHVRYAIPRYGYVTNCTFDTLCTVDIDSAHDRPTAEGPTKEGASDQTHKESGHGQTRPQVPPGLPSPHWPTEVTPHTGLRTQRGHRYRRSEPAPPVPGTRNGRRRQRGH